MRTCVVGGAGFIGRYLVDELVDTGRDVLVLGRKPEPIKPINPKALYAQCDYANRELLRNYVKQSNEVIDLAYATVPQTSFLDPIFDLHSNLPTSIGLVEECLRLDNLKTLLFVSSGGTVYGEVSNLPISEEAPTSPVSPYGITKLTIERYLLMYHKLHGLPSIVLRPSNAYGVGQLPFTGQGFIATAMGLILQRNTVTIFGENGTVRDYLHVKDLAKGICLALDNAKHGSVYNIGSGVGRDNRDVVTTIANYAEADGYGVNIAVSPPRGFDVSSNVLNFGKLLACSGWLPMVRFEDGVAEMWDNLKNQYKASI